jgi:hypothetical protein
MVNKLVLSINILAFIFSVICIVLGFITNDIFDILFGSFLTVVNILTILFTFEISHKK